MITCISDECPRARQDTQIKGEGEREEDIEKEKRDRRGRKREGVGEKGRLIYKKNSIRQKLWQLIIEYR